MTEDELAELGESVINRIKSLIITEVISKSLNDADFIAVNSLIAERFLYVLMQTIYLKFGKDIAKTCYDRIVMMSLKLFEMKH